MGAKTNRIKTILPILLLIFIGSISWSLTMVKSGIRYSYGLGFWGPNGHDGIWHIAITNSLARGGWRMPIFSGENIKNYHIGFDFLLAIINKITFIPIPTLYFQIIPVIFALTIGVSVYIFVLEWKKSKNQALMATFFAYFGGSFGYFVTLIKSNEIGGESLFWSQQAISTLINPPFALSLLCIFLGLFTLIKGLLTKNNRLLILSTFLFGVLVQIKIYAGVLVLMSLASAGLFMLLKRKGISVVKVFTGALIISILIFSPVVGSLRNNIIYKPFWFLESMVSTPDRFYWPRMASAIFNYNLVGNWIKLTFAYILTFTIFVIGNLGTRIIGLGYLISNIRKGLRNIDYIDVFIFSVVTLGFVIAMFFIQRGTPWNTIQFLYYSLVFSGVLAGIYLGESIDNKKNISIFITTLVILLTIPTTLGTLKHYLPARPPAKISYNELEALSFLSKQPDGIVLTQPFDKYKAEAAINNPPRPLYLYESTAYVSAFSGKTTYFEDEVNLEITGFNWRNRKEEVLLLLESQDTGGFRNFVKNNNISYIYLLKPFNKNLNVSQLGIENIFENKDVIIYQVN